MKIINRYMDQPLHKTLHEFCVSQVATMVFCAWVVHQVMEKWGENNSGDETVVLSISLLGAAVAGFLSAAADISRRQ